MEWGTEGCEEAIVKRPEFKGKIKLDRVTGREELIFSHAIRAIRQTIGFTIAIVFVMMVIIGVAAIFMFRAHYAVTGFLFIEDVSILASFMNAIQIKIFNFIYGKVAECLT